MLWNLNKVQHFDRVTLVLDLCMSYLWILVARIIIIIYNVYVIWYQCSLQKNHSSSPKNPPWTLREDDDVELLYSCSSDQNIKHLFQYTVWRLLYPMSGVPNIIIKSYPFKNFYNLWSTLSIEFHALCRLWGWIYWQLIALGYHSISDNTLPELPALTVQMLSGVINEAIEWYYRVIYGMVVLINPSAKSLDFQEHQPQ